jgi:tol-pal system protein YbgF
LSKPYRSISSMIPAPGLVAPILAFCFAALPALAEPVRQGAQPAAPGAARSAPAAADAGLKQRVEQLEEQLVDMQVVIGTLESLARGGATATASGGARSEGGGGAADVRLDGLETQVRALAAQIEQLTQQVRALSGTPRRSEAAPLPPATNVAPAAGTATASAPAGASDVDRFGSTTVTAGTGPGDPIRGLIDNDAGKAPAAGKGSSAARQPGVLHPPGSAAPGAPEAPGGPGTTGSTAAAGAETALAAAPPAFMPPPRGAGDGDNPKQLYETAYGYLMQRDYSAAEASFEDFLTRYPKDSLAGNAQYWLGEAHFVRGEYKPAAAAFLKGYKDYGTNARAADSLLKLAMSLDRLGQTDAACSSFSELSTRFPDAPDNVKSRANTEKSRIGCH